MKTDLIGVTEGNVERDRVVKILLDMAGVLKNIDVQNVECFANIKKPLNDLLSSLRELPSGSHFDILPIEIKTKILSYSDMCDAEAFRAASVCKEWKDILKERVEGLRKVRIGECWTKRGIALYPCENSVCHNPAEMLKASIILKLDIPLVISHPITEVDPNLITQALTSVSVIYISEAQALNANRSYPVMTPQQKEHLFVGLQNNKEIMNSVSLNEVDLEHLDQDKLASVFLYKTKKLKLIGISKHGEMLNRKLRDSNDIKLEHLYFDHLYGERYGFPNELSVDLADGLCKIKSVHLGFATNAPIIKARLIQNVLTGTFAMKKLFLAKNANWQDLITPNDLKNIIEKMDGLYLLGRFSTEQREVAQSIPGVKVLPSKAYGEGNYTIEKGAL